MVVRKREKACLTKAGYSLDEQGFFCCDAGLVGSLADIVITSTCV